MMEKKYKRYNAKELREIFLGDKINEKNGNICLMILSGLLFIINLVLYLFIVSKISFIAFCIIMFLMVFFLVLSLTNYNSWCRNKKIIEVNQ